MTKIRAALSLCLLACGPQVGLDDAGSGGSNPSTTDGDDTRGPGQDASSSPTDPSDTVADSTGNPPSVCGDGVLAPDEACDDGNLDNFDGCSDECRVSGTAAWDVDFDVGPIGFPVGLEVRDTDAYPAVQQFAGDLTQPDVRLARVTRSGSVLAEYLDPGGLSDLDLAKQPISVAADGSVVAGYPVTGDVGVPVMPPPIVRFVAQIDLSDTLRWGYLNDESWGVSHGTLADPEGAFILHDLLQDGQTRLVIDWFADDGLWIQRIDLGVDSTEFRPLPRGALLPRIGPVLGVLTWDTAGQVALHGIYLQGPAAPPLEILVDPVLTTVPDGPAPRAFFEQTRLRVWTQTEVAEIDAIGHPQPPTPRPVAGDVLVSFPGGLATVDPRVDGGYTLTVSGDDGTFHWAWDTDVQPRYARADGDRALFVLLGHRPEDPQVTLSYLIL